MSVWRASSAENERKACKGSLYLLRVPVEQQSKVLPEICKEGMQGSPKVESYCNQVLKQQKHRQER